MTLAKERTPLKRYLEEQGVTIGSLAKQVGVSRPFMSEIVNGTATDTAIARFAPRVATALDQPIDKLFPALTEEVKA